MTATGLYSEAPFVWNFGLTGKAVEEADDGGITISGIASDYLPDRDDEFVAREGLADGLRNYLKTNPVILWQHNFEKPVGRCTSAYLDDDGLHITARLAPATHPASWQADLLSKVRSGIVKSFSIGGRFMRKSPGRIERVDLVEISVCSAGSNPRAIFQVEPLAAVAGKAFSSANAADDLAAIKSTLHDLKKLKEHTTMKWKPKTRTEPQPRATLVTAEHPLDLRNQPLSKTELAHARARDADRAAEEAARVDTVVTTEHEVSGHDTAAIFGTIGAAEAGVVERDLSAGEVDGLFGVSRSEAVDPRSQGLGFLQMKELEAREGARRRAEQAKQNEWKKRLDALEEKAA